VGKLVLQDDHRLVGHFGAADRAAVGLLLVHRLNLATTSSSFHRLSIILIPP
jgi:hypothetical protein